MANLVLTVMGSDRPGLTQALSSAVLSAGGNWLESHLSQLAGLYVGSTLVEIDEAKVEALLEAVRAVDAEGLDVRIAPASQRAGGLGDAVGFNLVGQDRPGIVHQVTATLARLGVNIETFKSFLTSEPHSGAQLFHIDARLRLPAGMTSAAVQAELEAISGEIMVDVALSPLDAA